MLSFPNAKINLGLSITEKREDGFHNIETIMLPIELHDVLEVLPAPGNGGIHFQSTGLTIGGPSENNLIIKAYRLLLQNFDLPSVKVHLHKVIPMGAGLGGGSADASFFLVALNKLFDLGLNLEQLENYASRLGSDCAFFIKNQCALATGRGEILNPIKLNLKGNHIVLVHPGIHVGTAWAYSKITPKKREISLAKQIKFNIKNWKNHLKNDFESIVFDEHPTVKTIHSELYNMGADFAAMSGSGSAVFGIFPDKPKIDDQFKEMFVWQGEL